MIGKSVDDNVLNKNHLKFFFPLVAKLSWLVKQDGLNKMYLMVASVKNEGGQHSLSSLNTIMTFALELILAL